MSYLEKYMQGGKVAKPKPGQSQKPPQKGRQKPPQKAKQRQHGQQGQPSGGANQKVKQMAKKISEMPPEKQKQAIQQIAQKDKQMAQQVAQLVKKGGGQGGDGGMSQQRQQSREEFDQQNPEFETGGQYIPETASTVSDTDPYPNSPGMAPVAPNADPPSVFAAEQFADDTEGLNMPRFAGKNQGVSRQPANPGQAPTVSNPDPFSGSPGPAPVVPNPDPLSVSDAEEFKENTAAINMPRFPSKGSGLSQSTTTPGRAGIVATEPSAEPVTPNPYRSNTTLPGRLKRKPTSDPQLERQEQIPEQTDKQANPDNVGYIPTSPDRMERFDEETVPEEDPRSLEEELRQIEQLLEQEETQEEETEKGNSTEASDDGSGDPEVTGDPQYDLTDEELTEVGTLAQIAPQLNKLANSSKIDNMPLMTNEREQQALSSYRGAVNDMPTEVDMRDARMRNEQAYQSGTDRMYRNSQTASTARAAQSSLYGKKVRGSNQLAVKKNRAENQLRAKKSQLQAQLGQFEGQLGSQQAKRDSAYHKNKLMAEAAQRRIRQEALSSIGQTIAGSAKDKRKQRRDKRAMQMMANSSTDDVQSEMMSQQAWRRYLKRTGQLDNKNSEE